MLVDFKSFWDSGSVVCGDKMANATSRIVLNDECKMKFLELKTKRNHKFIVFKIEETIQQVVVEKLGEPDDKYEDLIASLPPEECRYAVFDLDFAANKNCRKSKTVFIAWSPDSSRARSKMLYASSKDRFIKHLDGAKLDLQATDLIERGKDNSRLAIFEFEDEVKQAISSATKMSFPLKKLSSNSHRSFQDFGRKAESIDFQYMLLGLYIAKFTSILLCGNKIRVRSNGKKVKNCENIIGYVVPENIHWLKKCAVGWMKKFLPVRVIKEEIKKELIIILEFRSMGGEMVLLHFDNELEMERLEEENWGCLLKYFKKIEKWSENLMVTKRSTWISCYGVPIHSWNIDTFREIANRVGEFVEVDNDTKSMQTFTRGNIHVYTSRTQRIEEWMELQVGSHVYDIRVVEIEPSLSSSSCCCCCCGGGGSFVGQSNSIVGLSSSYESMCECFSRVGVGGEDEMCRSEVKEQDEACDVEERLRILARVGSMEFDYRLDPSRDSSSIDSDEVDDDFGEEEEEVWKFNKSLGLYVDCDDNVIIKDFVRTVL